MLKVCHAGMRRILNTMVPLLGYTYHLFKNNHSVTRNSLLTDFVECDFSGYAAQLPAWIAAVQIGVEDIATAPTLTFTPDGSFVGTQEVWGYYVTDNLGDYAFGENFDGGPVTLTLPGQEVKIFPQFKDKNYGE